ncbi:Bug family tripartite tricarboxylate transporter substrate binding protein [Falsiroseomonas selenitidurans]|uniref:Tripartite tricarboxylate transporter substrate binding protein n=1 Tax=Falsiroseomonas selenitidurans TaxID=2716335 RepID=A0ABX1DY80_9PROT|nr:tripartite tricarboxylate transporter substrate binding protein [Falsiroseomonas selenitidurans]NKC29325.1 tripartite tricarboxylate transporter substrate binding protein [Falsiroseomonas selenitidurans]
MTRGNLHSLTRRAALALPGLLLLPRGAGAQAAWPDRPVRFIQGFGAGGTTDIVARLLAPHMSAAWGQPVVVENRPGAGGTLAANTLARANDGHTLMLLNNGFAVSAALYRSLPYDPRADIMPVAMVASTGLVILAGPNGPKDLAALIAQAKAQPDAINFATVGVGSTQHFVAEAVQSAGGFRMTHVPYRGTPAAIIALRNGEVQVVAETASAVLGQIRGGEVRALAITSGTRSPLLPEVPTVAEALGQAGGQAGGQPGFDIVTWYAIGAPAGTPAPVVARITAAAQQMHGNAELQTRLAALGLTPRAPGTPEQTRATVHAEMARWAETVARTGMERQ